MSQVYFVFVFVFFVASAGFWGGVVGGALEFVRCPAGYCCDAPPCGGFAACAAGRGGPLCGACTAGRSAGLDGRCVADAECSALPYARAMPPPSPVYRALH